MKIKRENLIYIFIYLCTFCKGIGLNNDSKIYMILILFGAFAVFLKIVCEKYTKKELAFIIFSLFLGFACLIMTRKPTLLLTCIALVGAKNINIKKMFLGILKIRLVTFCFMVFASLTGVIDNSIIKMWRIDHFDVRYTLGYAHPNTAHLSLFILFVVFIYCKYDNLKNYQYVAMFLINTFIYKFTISRTGYLIINILIIVTFLAKNTKIFTKVFTKTSRYVLILMIVLSFVTGILYGKNEVFYKLDNIFNGRISYANYFLKNYKPSLFGKNVQENTNAILDNGYILLYIQNGVLGFVYIIGLMLKTSKKIEKEGNIKEAIICVVSYIYFFTESFLPNIFMNIILFFAVSFVFSKDEGTDIQINKLKNIDEREIYIEQRLN